LGAAQDGEGQGCSSEEEGSYRVHGISAWVMRVLALRAIFLPYLIALLTNYIDSRRKTFCKHCESERIRVRVGIVAE
jgi:hypothetical protein